MTTIGFQLIRTLRSVSRFPRKAPRQILSREKTPLTPSSSSSSFSTVTTGGDSEPKIESLEDLESLLNVPAYGNRGEEFNKALQLEYDFFKYNGQLVSWIGTTKTRHCAMTFLRIGSTQREEL